MSSDHFSNNCKMLGGVPRLVLQLDPKRLIVSAIQNTHLAAVMI